MLLYDKMIAQGNRLKVSGIDIDTNMQTQIDLLNKSQVILADNIAHYLYSDSPQEDFDYRKDFPNIAPPFDTLFIEWKMPNTVNSLGEIYKSPSYGFHIGTLMASTCDIDHSPLKSLGAHWITQAWIYLSAPNMEKIVIHGFVQLAITKDGSLIDANEGMIYGPFSNRQTADEIHGIPTYLFVPLLTISFMHCKNVYLQSQNQPEGLSKKFKRQTGVPLAKYKILEIKAMQHVLNTEGDRQKSGLKYALHVCRGHFKTFDSEHRLFGKHEGTYWWNSQVRGSANRGVVVKDYNVNPPSDH